MPEMIYDFHGFPDELYQVDYPIKGGLKLAERVAEILQNDDISMNSERGYDHGTWAVLKHLYPQVDVPVVQSFNHTKSA